MTLQNHPTVSRIAYFITHPNVLISRDVPVTEWPLSDLGRRRMTLCLKQPWVADLTAVYSSTEQKAVDGAEILSNFLNLRFVCVPELGENNRSSTGFLPPHEFEAAADRFFAMPEVSFRGWERAIDAQHRIVAAIARLLDAEKTSGPVAFVSHGAVGTLLYCALAGRKIDRRWDQPQNGGGNYFRFSLFPRCAYAWWKAIDELEDLQGQAGGTSGNVNAP